MSIKEKFEASLNGLLGKVDWEEPLSVAKYFKTITELYEVIKEKIDKPKELLKGFKQTFYFPEESIKVSYSEGSEETELDVKSIARELIENKRGTDLINIVSISQKDLKSLDDGEVFIAKYKKVVGKKEPTISLKSMTKAEIKEHNKTM